MQAVRRALDKIVLKKRPPAAPLMSRGALSRSEACAGVQAVRRALVEIVLGTGYSVWTGCGACSGVQAVRRALDEIVLKKRPRQRPRCPGGLKSLNPVLASMPSALR